MQYTKTLTTKTGSELYLRNGDAPAGGRHPRRPVSVCPPQGLFCSFFAKKEPKKS